MSSLTSVDLKNYNKIFRKDVSYDNIKGKKKIRAPPFLKKTPKFCFGVFCKKRCS